MAKSLNPFAKQIFNTECMNLCHNQGFNNDLLAEIVYKTCARYERRHHEVETMKTIL